MVFCDVMSLIPEHTVDTRGSMAESTGVKPYQFEPTVAAPYSDKESDSEESDTNVREQASFMERLQSMDWCGCAKCIPMLRGIECQCYREMDNVQERLMEQEEIGCITNHDQFAVVCLNKDVTKTFQFAEMC